MTQILFNNQPVNHPEDYQKILGTHVSNNIVMTDESGAVIAAGDGMRALNRSMPLVKSLKENNSMLHVNANARYKPEVLKKSEPTRRVMFIKDKSPKTDHVSGSLHKSLRELQSLKKSLSVTIDVDNDAPEEVWAWLSELDDRVTLIESKLDQVIGLLSAKQ